MITALCFHINKKKANMKATFLCFLTISHCCLQIVVPAVGASDDVSSAVALGEGSS